MLRPIDFFHNPEYALVTITGIDARLYVGNNQQLELLEQWEAEAEAPHLHLVGQRPHRALRRFALHLLQLPRLTFLPVVVAGESELIRNFLKTFEHPYGTIPYAVDHIAQLTCPQLIAESQQFRGRLIEIYLHHFRQRLKSLRRIGRVVVALPEIRLAQRQGTLLRLLCPDDYEQNALEREWGNELLADGVLVNTAPAILFPTGVRWLAILRGEAHAHTPLFAVEA